MIITPNLHFNGECEQALKLYEKVFKGKITTLMHYSDADPSDLSIVVTFESVDEVKDAYSMLSVGGSDIVPLKETTYSTCMVSLVDRFGVRWELMTENNS